MLMQAISTLEDGQAQLSGHHLLFMLRCSHGQSACMLVDCLRGNAENTSALRGEEGSENRLILRMNSTDKLREMRMRGRGVSKIS